MRAYELAVREHGKRWQLLEAIFEACEGRLIRGYDVVEIARGELGMDRTETLEHVQYLIAMKYVSLASPHFVSLLPAGVEAITKVALDLLHKEDDLPPLLWLEEPRSRKVSPRCVAVLKGAEQFKHVDQKIGVRQLLILHMILASKFETKLLEGPLTVVSIDEIARELVRWAELGAVKLGGADAERPENRVRKDWSEFLRQIERQAPSLKGLFQFISSGSDKARTYYGIALPAAQVRSQLWNLDWLLREAAKEETSWDESTPPKRKSGEDEDEGDDDPE